MCLDPVHRAGIPVHRPVCPVHRPDRSTQSPLTTDKGKLPWTSHPERSAKTHIQSPNSGPLDHISATAPGTIGMIHKSEINDPTPGPLPAPRSRQRAPVLQSEQPIPPSLTELPGGIGLKSDPARHDESVVQTGRTSSSLGRKLDPSIRHCIPKGQQQTSPGHRLASPWNSSVVASRFRSMHRPKSPQHRSGTWRTVPEFPSEPANCVRKPPDSSSFCAKT